MLDVLLSGEVPAARVDAADPAYLAGLVRSGVIRLDLAALAEAGVLALPDKAALDGYVLAVVGPERLAKIQRVLEADGGGLEGLYERGVLTREEVIEIGVRLKGAAGGIVVKDGDGCTEEERADLRRRLSDLVTDWADHEHSVALANAQNARDGLDLFIRYVDAANGSVDDGISATVGTAGEAALWLFGAEVALAGVMLGIIAGALSDGVTESAPLNEAGIRALESLRDDAIAAIEARVEGLRDGIVDCGNDCARLRRLVEDYEDLPRTDTTPGLAVYRALLIRWGRGLFGDDLRGPNPRRRDPAERDRYILYGGYTDYPSWWTWDGNDLVEEINRLTDALRP